MVTPPFNAGRIKRVTLAMAGSFVKKENTFYFPEEFPLYFTGQNIKDAVFSSFSLCGGGGQRKMIILC